ncbi:hypothetical protein JTB14_018137 [Gonioctena quinquepunctata]|nr:hypothetical protein JTB14_018137 [Gonioctena quinquepunctata]
MICGDFSCRHKSWQNSTNNRGGIILNNILEEDRIVINNDNQQTVPALQSKSIIDLFITSVNLFDKIAGCRTSVDIFGSDHFPVMLELRDNTLEDGRLGEHEGNDFENRIALI